MKRCTFPAGCTETATGVDAYDHPVCDRHAPLDMEIVVMPEKWVDSAGPARIEADWRALDGGLVVTGIDRENGVVTIGVKK